MILLLTMFIICNDQITKARRSMTHAEVVIARRAVEEGRGLVVVVNKMDLLSGRKNSELYKKVKEAVPQEIQTVIPQVCPFNFYVLFFIMLFVSSGTIPRLLTASV